MKLTPHFTLEEFIESDTALRLGIDNRPPAPVVDNLKVTAVGMEQIREVLGFPVFISSGFRCEELEKVLCWRDYLGWCRRHGKDSEFAWPEYFARKGHPKGWCADWTCRGYGTPRRCILAVRQAGVLVDQLIEEGTWAHASFDPRLRGEVLTARFNENGEPTYTQGVV